MTVSLAASKTRKRRRLFDALVAQSVLEQTSGIMLKRDDFTPLVFEFAFERQALNAIHSFFCPRFDAVFLDSQKKVIATRAVAPNSFIVPPARSKYLIEAPSGAARGARLRAGDKLSW